MNDSVASGHFPQIVWREGVKHLWNPIHKKALKNLPEERVRLCVLEYLAHGGWSKHRISTEEAIDYPDKEASLRTDLICYTQYFNPFLLVECKADTITLSDKTAEQIARYNRRVGAPFLLMTNGRRDYWYSLEKEAGVRSLDRIPDRLPARSSPETHLSYWKERGLAGTKALANLRVWLNSALNIFLLNEPTHALRYLSFKTSPCDINLSQYYRIISVDDHRLAIAFTATEFGGSRMMGILNREGKNEAILEINLDLLFDKRSINSSIYWAEGVENLDMRRHSNCFGSTSIDVDTIAGDINALLLDTIK